MWEIWENRRMAQHNSDSRERVGPVLQTGAVADAIIAAITQLNAEAVVIDRGAYRRVSVLQRCLVTRAAMEEQLGRPVHFPADLETVMPAFKGRLTVSEDQAVWVCEAPQGRTQDGH
jgi:toluene monooxygenase system protein D